jgi:hypothetical protein
MLTGIRTQQLKLTEIEAKIALLPNLTDEQRVIVSDIALGHIKSQNREPSYEGIAAHVRKTYQK